MSVTQVCVFDPVLKLVNALSGVDGSLVPSKGQASAGVPVVLNPDGIIDPTLINMGVTAVAGTPLTAGNLVTIYAVNGVLQMQVATADPAGDGSTGPGPFPAQAQAFVLDNIQLNQTGTLFFAGVFQYIDPNNEFSGSDVGAEVYLSAINLGGITKTAPVGGGKLEQAVGYVVSYDAATKSVAVSFLAGYQDFSHISGVNPISKGGTGATTAAGAIQNLFQTQNAATVFSGPASGGAQTPVFRALVNTDLAGAVFVASGASHKAGAVPDPGAGSGTTHFLREDATWSLLAPASLTWRQVFRSSSNVVNAGVMAGPLSVVFPVAFADNNYTVTLSVECAEAISDAPAQIAGFTKQAAGAGLNIWLNNMDTLQHNLTIHIEAEHD